MLIFLVFVMSGCLARTFTVEGNSMLSTIKSGDVILVSLNTANLSRGDIIIFNDPQKKDYTDVCRIIGMPGEKITITENRVLINDQMLNEPYVLPENNEKNLKAENYYTAQNSYFVLGDNRDHSKDSRNLGSVPQTLIVGKYYSKVLNSDSDEK